MNQFRNRATGVVISEQELREAFAFTALPHVLDLNTLHGLNYDPVLLAPPPEVSNTQTAIQVGVVQDTKGNWVQGYMVVDKDPEVVAAEKIAADKQFQAMVINNVQSKLDAFAHTRGYGDANGNGALLSACTYATSTIPSFAAEGQYCVSARDATWAKLYQLLEEVNKGARKKPDTFEEIDVLLPVLAWPK